METQWAQILTIIGANLIIFLTIIGLMVSLYFHTDNKISAIHEEMKDFHSRLLTIEERNKPKII